MAPRLRPRLEALETHPAWAESPRISHDDPYRDLLRCPKDDREIALRELVRRGIPDEDARRLKPTYLSDYRRVSRRLMARHGFRTLARAGLLSRRGNLIFYRHRLLLPLRHRNKLVGVAGPSLDAHLMPAVLLPHGLLLPHATRQKLDDFLGRLQEPAALDPQLTLGFR